jgi:hypothetical protein
MTRVSSWVPATGPWCRGSALAVGRLTTKGQCSLDQTLGQNRDSHVQKG